MNSSLNRLFIKLPFGHTELWRAMLRKFNFAVLMLILLAMFDLLASSTLILRTLALPAPNTALSSSPSAARLRPSASFLHSSSNNNNAQRRVQLRRGPAALVAKNSTTDDVPTKQAAWTTTSATSSPAATTSSSVIVLGLHQPADNINIISARSGMNTTQMNHVRSKLKQRNHVSLNIVDTSRRSKLQPKRISSAQSESTKAKAAITALAVAMPPLQSKALVMSPLARIINNVNSSTFSPTTTVPSVLTTAATKKIVFREALSAAKQKQLLRNDTREREVEAASTTLGPSGGNNIVKLRPSSRSGTLLTKQAGGANGPTNNNTINLNGNSTKKSASMIETEHLLLLGAMGGLFGGGGMGGGGGGGIGGSYARTGGYPVAAASSPVGHFMGGGGFPMLGALALAEGFEMGGDLMKGLMGMSMMSRMMGPPAQQQVGGGNGGTFGTEPYSPGGYVHTGLGMPA